MYLWMKSTGLAWEIGFCFYLDKSLYRFYFFSSCLFIYLCLYSIEGAPQLLSQYLQSLPTHQTRKIQHQICKRCVFWWARHWKSLLNIPLPKKPCSPYMFLHYLIPLHLIWGPFSRIEEAVLMAWRVLWYTVLVILSRCRKRYMSGRVEYVSLDSRWLSISVTNNLLWKKSYIVR